jgi:hypothetical protein
VAAETDDDARLLLDDAALKACDGDPRAMVAAIEAAVEREGLAWPAA